MLPTMLVMELSQPELRNNGQRLTVETGSNGQLLRLLKKNYTYDRELHATPALSNFTTQQICRTARF
jgi:hypothetical protein